MSSRFVKKRGAKSKEISSFLGITEQKVNRWLWRYKLEGLKGLEIRQGHGRAAILQTKDTNSIKLAVQKHRQRISQAKVELEKSLGKEFSQKTLERFLKNLTAAINESESV